MSMRLLLINLVTAFLVLTMAPAVADTSPAPAKKLPRNYQAVVDGKSGAREVLQLEILSGVLYEGLQAYERQTGSWPATGEALLEAGLLPFRPMDAGGQPMRIVSLGEGELPPLDAIGIRMRENECTLIRMGADGDPLAPIMQTLNRMVANNQMNWLAEYPWSARRTLLMERTIRGLMEAYATFNGRLPATPEELQQQLQLTPVGCEWQPQGTSPAYAVQCEVDAYGAHLRTTQSPATGYEHRKTYTLDTMLSNRRLEFDPLAIATVPAWNTVGTLVWTDPIPSTLAAWIMPPFPEKVDLRRGRPLEPTAVANAAMLSMWCWLIDWYVPQVKATPTPAWLIDTGLQLHDPLDEQGEAMIAIPSPIPLDAPPPDDLGPIPSRVILYVGKDMVSQVILPSKPSYVKEDLSSGRGYGFMPPVPAGGPQHTGSPWPIVHPPTDPTLLTRAFELASDDERRMLQDFAWDEAAKGPDGFDVQYAAHAGQVFTEILAGWLDADHSRGVPDSWQPLLSDVRLRARGYYVLPPEAPRPTDAAIIVLSMTPDRRFIRTITELPNGLVTFRYARTLIDGPFVPSRISLNPAHDQPEFAALEYKMITMIVLPIPDPPALPEVAAP